MILAKSNGNYRIIYDDIVRSIIYPLYNLNKQTSFGLDTILPNKDTKENLSMYNDSKDMSFIDRFISLTIELFIVKLSVMTVDFMFYIIVNIINKGINIFHNLFLNIHDKFKRK